MAPPRPHHHVAHHHHNHGGSSSGGGGSPFPPLGMAASGTVSAAFHNGPSNNTASGAETSAGLPPAPAKVDTNQAQEYRLQDAYWSDEDETMECPLCLEEIDISDANFKPCPCGYQICRFCWHHINQNLNGRCPACRRKYTDNAVEFKPMTAEEIKRLSQAKKQKEREKKELEQMNRKHLANVRVVQKNLVYVVGLDPKLAREELIPTLRSNDFFGQYGRISKVLISKRTTASKLMMGTTESAIGVYVTYVRKEDAARAIIAIDGSKGPDGKTIRASYGTTKYCTTYLRNLPCTNAICTYLHEPGEEADSFTKEDLTTLRHAAKDAESRGRLTTPAPASFAAGHKAHQNAHVDQANTQQQHSSPVASSASVNLSSLAPAPDSVEASALPKTASWASSKPGGAPPQASSIAQHNAIRDSDLPTLSASMARRGSGTQQQRASPAKPSIPTAPKGRTAPRPGSPAPSSPAAQVPPGLAAKPPPGLVPKGPSAMQRGRSESVEPLAVAAAPASNNASAPPPGLAKVASNGPPPGLPAPSRSATPSGEPVLSAPSSTSTSASPPSSYQPSSTAQALLDDMRARREAEADRPQKSAFSDLDAVLQSFQDGAGFSFTFEEDRLADKMGTDEDRENEGYLGAFAPFAGVPSPGIQPLSVLGRGPGRGMSEPPTYSGSFDPFAPGAGESIEESPEEQQSKASPFAAIDEMRRTLSDERKEAEEAAVEEERESREDDSQADSPSKGASRFGFARRPDSETFVGTPSGPPSFKTHDDLLGFVRGGAAALTSNGHAQQDQAALQSQQQQQQQHPPHNDGQPDVSWLHADNRASYGNAGNVAAANRNAYKSMQANVHGQQQTRPGSSSLAMGNGHFGLGVNRSFGAGTPPPPGFGPRQQSGGPPGLMLQQQQQQQQQHVNGNASNDFLAQLQRGSAQGQASLHHLHQAQTPSSMDQRMNGGYFGRDQSTSNNVATGSSNEPPFAQLVAAAEARRAQSSYTVHKNASQGGGGIDGMPFSDPAIMSFARQQQQQHHQQQQQHHQQQQQHHHHHHQHQQQHQSQQGQHYGGGAGGGFSPFDSQQQMSNQHLPSWGGQEQQASWNGPFGSHQPYS